MSSKLSGNGPAIETFVRLRDSGLFQGVSSSSSLSGAKRTPIIWPFTSARRTISSTPCRLILRIEDKNSHWSVWGANRRISRRSEEHTSELQSQSNLVCRLLLEKKNTIDSSKEST